MKKILKFLIVVLVLFSAVEAMAAGWDMRYASHYKYGYDENGNMLYYDDRGGIIVDYFDSTDGVVVIPTYVDGCKITKIGDDVFNQSKNNGVYVSEVIIPEGITAIGNHTFAQCKDIKKITLPQSLEYIGEGAFLGCTSLEEIVIPTKIKELTAYAFNDCTSLKSVTFNNVTTIGDFAFANTALSEIEIPDSVSYIGKRAFYNTPWLNNYDADFVVVNNILICYKGGNKAATLPKNVYHIGPDAFNGTSVTAVTFHDKVKTIGDRAFANTIYLTHMVIPETVSEIGTHLFEYSGVSTVIFPSHITKIPDYTFYQSKITSFCLTDNITEIGDYAYYKTACLSPIPETVAKIGDYAFYNNSNFKALTFNNVEIGEYAFSECTGLQTVTVTGTSKIGNSAFSMCTYLKLIEIGDNASIGDFAFNMTMLQHIDGVSDKIKDIGENPFFQTTYWSSVKKNDFVIVGDGVLIHAMFSDENADLVIPEGVKRIAPNAFNQVLCNRVILPSTLEKIMPSGFAVNTTFYVYPTTYKTGINEIVLPEGYTQLDPYAFKNCRTLTKINLPEGIKVIPDGAFAGCTSLTNIDINGLEELGAEAFMGTKIIEGDIHIPETIKKLGKNCLFLSGQRNVYIKHLPTGIENHPFGIYEGLNSNTAQQIKLHVSPDLLNYNPDWNDYSLVLHYTPQIVDSGEDYITVYFPRGTAGVDNFNFAQYEEYIRINNGYLSYKLIEIIDDNTVKLTVGKSNMGKELYIDTFVQFDEFLVQYDPITALQIVKPGQDTEADADDFTYTPNGAVVSYYGNADIVKIPSKIGETTITSVLKNAFSRGDILIYVPETVTVLKKDFAKHQNTALYFEGAVPELEDGAVTESMKLYSNKPTFTTDNGFEVLRALTDDISSFYKMELTEDYKGFTVSLNADLADTENALVLVKVTYYDRPAKIFAHKVKKGFNSFDYSEDVWVKSVKTYLIDTKTIRPLSYFEEL